MTQAKKCPKCGKQMAERTATDVSSTPAIGSDMELLVYSCECGYEEKSMNTTRHP